VETLDAVAGAQRRRPIRFPQTPSKKKQSCNITVDMLRRKTHQ
jgi:hypothetical protein